MVERIRSTFYGMYMRKDYGGEDEFSRFLLTMLGTLFATFLHGLLLVFFFVTGFTQLAIINVFSLSCYSVAIYLVLHRKYEVAGIILMVEVPLYVFASVFLIGSQNYIYLYLFIVAIAVIVLPYYLKPNARVRMALFIWACMIGTLCLDLFHDSVHDFSPYTDVMTAINLNTAMIAVVIELLVVNSVYSLVASFHEMRITQLQDQVNIDPLTKLYNRRYADAFFSTLGSDLSGTSFYVAIADIDDFKLVNDRYGHDVGDEVLKAYAEVMTSTLRSSDTVFRWGGEEFLIVLASASLESAHSVLEKLNARIREHQIVVNTLSLCCTMTMGLAPLHLSDVRASIVACDDKLYIGKRSGKNRVVS